MAEKKVKVKVKKDCSHRLLPDGYKDGDHKGEPGALAEAGDVIEVTPAELESFGDKFEVV